MKTLQLLASVLVAALLVPSVLSLPGGPPLNTGSFENICNQMMPIHSGNAAQSGSGGYLIVSPNMPRFGSTGFSYTAGQNYTGSLEPRFCARTCDTACRLAGLCRHSHAQVATYKVRCHKLKVVYTMYARLCTVPVNRCSRAMLLPPFFMSALHN